MNEILKSYKELWSFNLDNYELQKEIEFIVF
jgi:hypothetical protein